MGRSIDKSGKGAQPPRDDARPGHVEVDSRGRNVWRWNGDSNESTSVVLERLDNKDLALEPTQKVPIARGGAAQPKPKATPEPAAANVKPSKAEAAAKAKPRGFGRPDKVVRDKGGGFDPYNSR